MASPFDLLFKHQGLTRYTIAMDIYIYSDSQAALKRLQNISLKGGQELVNKITKACKRLSYLNTIYLSWVPGHYRIPGNDHADRLAKAGLTRKPIEPYTSISYLESKLRANLVEDWKNYWNALKQEKKGKTYRRTIKDSPSIKLKATKLKYPRSVQSAYYQLLLGKGFFKAYSYAIGRDEDDLGQCPSCQTSQTPIHLVLYCKQYKAERKELKDKVGRIDYPALFLKQQGQKALLEFLDKTRIGTASWLQKLKE